MWPRRYSPSRDLFGPGEQLDQRGLACAVDADQGDAVSALDHEVDVAEDFFVGAAIFPGIALGHAFELGHDAAAGLGLRERKVDRLFFRRNLDALDLLQFLDAALHLLGLGRLVAEAVDEDFELLDAVALVAVGGRQLLVALRLLGEELVVVAGVEPEALVPDFGDLVDRDVEKVAVVRDQHEGVRIVLQIFFQPVAGFEIEMVRRLVEQQQVGLLQKKLGEGEAHLPSAGEFVGQARPVFFREAQAHQDASDFGFDRVAVAGAEFVFDAVVAVGDGVVFRAGVVEFRHAVRERFEFRFHGAQVVEDRHALGEDAAAGEREAVLRKISGGRAFGDDEAAVVEGVHAGEDLHERGLAGAVAADQADAVAGRDEPVRVFEEEFVAETFSGAGELNHISFKIVAGVIVS